MDGLVSAVIFRLSEDTQNRPWTPFSNLTTISCRGRGDKARSSRPRLTWKPHWWAAPFAGLESYEPWSRWLFSTSLHFRGIATALLRSI